MLEFVFGIEGDVPSLICNLVDLRVNVHRAAAHSNSCWWMVCINYTVNDIVLCFCLFSLW